MIMLDSKSKIDELTNLDLNEALKGLLTFLIGIFEDYINGNLSDEELSDITVYWYAIKSEFSYAVIGLDSRVASLGSVINLASSDFSRARKIQSVVNLKSQA